MNRPLSRRAAPVAALAALLLLPSAASAAPGVGPRIINGQDATAPQPYQAAIWTRDAPRDVWCGGTLVNAHEVVTAAHCVEGERAADLAVTLGLVDQTESDASQGAETHLVDGIRSAVDYDPVTVYGDVAVLRFDEEIEETPGSIEFLELATDGDFGPGRPAIVSGWGNREPDGEDYPAVLQRAILSIRDDSDCDGLDAWEDLAASMICAGGDEAKPPLTDTCQGDSGGPLALTDTTTPLDEWDAIGLVGIVSFGNGCGEEPGAYTDVTVDPANTLISDDTIPDRPESTVAPSVAGVAQPGRTLTCNRGSWTGAPALSSFWIAGEPGDAVVVDDGPTLALGPADVGVTFACVVRAENDGGWNELASDGREVGAAPVRPQPKPQPKPEPRPFVDALAPTARIAKRSCKKRRCTITLNVADNAALSGVTVRATIKRLSGCKKGRKGRTCRKAKRLKVTVVRDGVFRLRTERLKPARYRVTAVVADAAGNRRTTRATFRIRRKR